MPILTEKPADNDVCKLADWMEVNSLLDTDQNTSILELAAILSNGLEEGDDDDQIEASESDQLAQEVLNELKARTTACGEEYPFILKGELLSAKPNHDDFTAYIYCLLVSYCGVMSELTPWTHQKIAKEFENLCAQTLENLYSTESMPANIRTFGFPRKEDGYTGTDFVAALKKVCKESGEMNPVNMLAAAARKDAGLDIICWKKFPDGLRGGLLFWGQCATGANWSDKLHDLLNFKAYVTVPVGYATGVFMPHMVDTTTPKGLEEWDVWTIYTGSVFNRCRIAHLSKSWSNAEMKTFCRTTLTNMLGSVT